MLNMDYQKYSYIFTILFIIGMGLHHLIDLTRFLYNYNSAYDYGKSVRDVCKKEYFEYETERFQVAANKDNIKLQYDNQSYYIIFVTVIIFIIALAVSYMFTYNVYNVLFNQEWFGQDYKSVKGISFLFYLLRHVWNHWRELFNSFSNVFMSFYIFFAYVIILFIGCILPIYFTVHLETFTDISPFTTTNNYFAMYIVFFALIVIARFIFVMKYVTSLTYFDDKNVTFASIITFFILFGMYVFTFYILRCVVNLLNKQRKQSDDIKDQTIPLDKDNIFGLFYDNVLGFKYMNNDTKLSGLSSIILIILLILAVIYGIFLSNIFITSYNDMHIIWFSIIICIILYILFMLISNFTEYNAMINKYIVEQPSYFYKKQVELMNSEFNNALDNEYTDIQDNKQEYICRDYANAILSVLYCHLFDEIENIDRNMSDDKSSLIDLTPEFEYDGKCDNVLPYEFSKHPEYNISYYLNSKQFKKSIFYRFDKCTDVNILVLNKVYNNTILRVLNRIGEDKKPKLLEYLYNESKFDINNPKFKLLKDALNDEIESLTSRILKAMSNVSSKFVYYKTSADDIKNIEFQLKFNKSRQDSDESNDIKTKPSDVLYNYQINNKLRPDIIFAKDYTVNMNEQMFYYRDFIRQKIVKPYMGITIEFFKIYPKIVIIKNDKNKQDISKLIGIITRVFDKINQHMSEPIYNLKTGKLSKYIIMNYNSIIEKPYTRNFLRQKILSQTKETTDGIENLSNFLMTLKKDYTKIVGLYNLLKQNEIPEYIIQNENIGKTLEEYKPTFGNYIIDISSSQYLDENSSFQVYVDTLKTYNEKKVFSINNNTLIPNLSMLNDACINLLNSLYQNNVIILESQYNSQTNQINAMFQELEQGLQLLQSKPEMLKDKSEKDMGPVEAKQYALNITANALQVNQLIYMVIFNYAVALLMAKLIVI